MFSYTITWPGLSAAGLLQSQRAGALRLVDGESEDDEGRGKSGPGMQATTAHMFDQMWVLSLFTQLASEVESKVKIWILIAGVSGLFGTRFSSSPLKHTSAALTQLPINTRVISFIESDWTPWWSNSRSPWALEYALSMHEQDKHKM